VKQLEKWTAPQEGWIKLNTDVGFCPNSVVAAKGSRNTLAGFFINPAKSTQSRRVITGVFLSKAPKKNKS
jgi:hypothetical protein